MQVLHDRFANDPQVSVLAIHFEDRGKVCGHIEDGGYTFPVVLNGGDIWKRYDIFRFPTFLVIGPDGRVIYNHPGRLSDEARDEIEQVAMEARPKAGP